MTRPTYDTAMVEWLATVHDSIERLAARASETNTLYDSWEWIFEETSAAVDIDGSANDDGYLTTDADGGAIYLGSVDGTYDYPVILGVREVSAAAAHWMETFDPAAIMERVDAERSIVELWYRAYHDNTERPPYVAAMDSVVMRLAAGWAHMPGYQAGWRPAAMVGA